MDTLRLLLDAGDYTIAREVIVRGVALLYVLAFLSSFHQFPPLLGEKGLLPAPVFIARTDGAQAPSLFRWSRTPYSDRLLRIVCVIGMVLGASVVLGLPQLGPAWALLPVFGAMWMLYLSIVSIGQRFYGFGWESMLLEAGALVGFLGTTAVAPPLLMILFLRWLMLRLEFGAGMIKMRGDPAWRNLTAMEYHHQTQPLPNPLSRAAHLAPRWWHRCEALGSHIVQLGAPWLLFLPQPFASIGAIAIIATQLALVLTGNYAWLNWLTIVIAFCGISDSFLRWTVGGPWPGWGWQHLGPTGEGLAAGGDPSPIWWQVLIVLVVAGLVILSREPLLNLFSRDQKMNASYNRWHLVNSYGAFGSMTRERREVIIEATEDDAAGAAAARTSATAARGGRALPPELEEGADESAWVPYGFRAKPGDVARTPPQVAPYHLRLDWMMWFLPLGDWGATWFLRLLEHLRDADPAILRLLRRVPFEGRPPAAVRVRVFDYRFTTREEKRESGDTWVRSEIMTLVVLRRRDAPVR